MRIMTVKAGPESSVSHSTQHGYDNIQVVRAASRSPMRYLQHRTDASELIALVRETQADLINLTTANNRAMMLQCTYAARITDKPMVIYRGAIGGLSALSPIDNAIFRHRNLRRVLVRTFAMSTAWANNPGMRFLIPPEKVEVTGRPIKVAEINESERTNMRSELGLAREDFAVGSVANSRPIKNLEFTAHVVAELVKTGKPVKLVLIGRIDETMVQRLKSICGDHLVATGFKTNAARLSAGFDIFISPTRRPGEGFGKAIAEAMAQGIPAISSNFGGACDIVESGTTGFLLPLNVHTWARAIGQLMDDEKWRKTMGAAAQDRIRHLFSEQIVQDRIKNIFADVIEEWQKINGA